MSSQTTPNDLPVTAGAAHHSDPGDPTPWRHLIGMAFGLTAALCVLVIAFVWPATSMAPHEVPIVVAGPPAVAAAVGIVERAGAREGVDVTRIALHAWAESLRDAQIRALAQEAYSTMRGYLAAVADRAQQAGKAGLGSTPDEIAKAMLSLVIGYLMQRLVTQDVAAGAYVEAVRSLLGRPAAESAALTAGAAAGSGRLPT